MKNKRFAYPTLGEVFSTTSGGTPSRKKKEYYENGTILWVKSGELGNNVITDTEEKITPLAIEKSSAKVFPPGTLLIALYGATIGKLAFLGTEAATNQAVCGIFEKEGIDHKYTFHFLSYNRRHLINLGIGGAQPNISQGILKSQFFPLPPLPEQRAIVSKLEQLFSELEDGVANLQKAQRQLKVYRQAVLKKAFEGELTREWRAQQTGLPTAEELLAQIQAERERYYEEQLAEWKQAVADWEADGKVGKKPRKPGKLLQYDLSSFAKRKTHHNWVEVPLGFAINSLDQGWSPKCKSEPSTDEDWGVIKTSAIQRMSFNSNENKTLPKDLKPRLQHELKQGDILITRAGPRVRVGIACLITKSPQKLLNCDKAYRIKTEVADKKWLVALLNSPKLLHDIEEIKSGINDSGVNLKQDIFLNLCIPLCSLPEQHQIVQEIESRLSVCDQLEKDIEANLKRAERLRQSLLQKAFAGELLTEAELQACRAAPDWEPAEKLLERIKGEAKIDS